MRFLLIIFLFVCIGFACVKPKTKDPVPVIEYLGFEHAQISEFTGSDTAVLVLGYEDGDGDLFLDRAAEGPNVIFTPWHFNEILGRFDTDVDAFTQDTQRITGNVLQPDQGYYKGKSIKGNIYIPMSQFRSSPAVKIIKFTGFVVDVKGNKSNMVTSPIYTLNF